MKIIDEIIRREGGFVNHVADRGGATNYGITIGTLSAWRGKQVTVNDVRNLTLAEAKKIYEHQYIIQPNFHRIENAFLREVVVDAGVHSGTRTSARWLQRAVGVTADGIIGPITLAAVNRADSRSVAAKCLAHRVRFLGNLITRDRSQAAFAAGWANRLGELIERV
jgi:lysozyme family protein